jgi:hypothetical protein
MAEYELPVNKNRLASRSLLGPDLKHESYAKICRKLPPECKAWDPEGPGPSHKGADWSPDDWKTRRCIRCPFRPPGSQYSKDNVMPGRDGAVFGCQGCQWALYLDDERVALYPPQDKDINVCFCGSPSTESSAGPSGSMGYELWGCHRMHCGYFRTVPLPKPRRYKVEPSSKGYLVLVPDKEEDPPVKKGSGLRNMVLAEP